MHIMEGFLPPVHAVAWTAASVPFLGWGLFRLRRKTQEHPESKIQYGFAAAWCCALSALKIPSVTGSSSHPTGTGLGTALFGPGEMCVFAFLVLLFQALFLAHGGLTTLGANLFSMGIAGPWAGWCVLRVGLCAKASRGFAFFLCAFVANMATYLATSLQLALAFPDASGGIAGAFVKFAGLFALTQIPLALAEGAFSVFALKVVLRYAPQDTLVQAKETT